MKIYYDVTHLIGWKGGLTGIPRTTDEIGIRLKERNDVEFVTWDISIKQFLRVDKRYYYDVVSEKNRKYFKDADSSMKHLQKNTIHKKVARRVLVELPFLGKVVRKLSAYRKGSSNTVRYEKGLVGEQITLNKGDMLFIPCGLWDDKNYIKYIKNVRTEGIYTAFMCYDLLPIVVPQFSGQWGEPMKNFTKNITAHCDIVFSISEYTKQDLIKWLKENNLPIPKIEVIRLGDVYELHQPMKPTDTKIPPTILNGEEEYILCTGTVEARKNHTLLYYVYKLANARGVKLPKTLVVGRPGHRTENIIDIIQDDPETKNSILFQFDTSDQELAWLYRHCRFTIYPSWYEGWGLPIAESIANGVPCITSNTSSMVEVADGFVQYFNPSSPEECLASIINYLKDKELKKARDKAAKYEPVSWDVTYNQVDNALSILSQKVEK